LLKNVNDSIRYDKIWQYAYTIFYDARNKVLCALKVDLQHVIHHQWFQQLTSPSIGPVTTICKMSGQWKHKSCITMKDDDKIVYELFLFVSSCRTVSH